MDLSPNIQIFKSLLKLGKIKKRVFHYIHILVRQGKYKLLTDKFEKDASLLEYLVNEMDYGFTEYHSIALQKIFKGEIDPIEL